MWFGRVVPLLQFPLIDRQADRSALQYREVEEERSMPLLNELCMGMNIEDGTALYVTYGINDDLKKWGDDIAGWFAIAPFPLTLFKTNQLMHLEVNLINKPGAFKGGVTNPIKLGEGVFLYMEVLGTGDVGGLILHKPGKAKEIRDKIEAEIGEEKKLRSIELRLWGEENKISSKSIRKRRGVPSPKGWYSVLKNALTSSSPGSPKGRWPEQLFGGEITWADDRRILVRDRHIIIPYGEFWYKLTHTNDSKGGNTNSPKRSTNDSNGVNTKSPIRPNYCLLARDMELPILLALIPNRPLFRIDMNVSVREGQNPVSPVGVGIMDNVAERLEHREVNIWNIHETHRSLSFHPLKNDKGEIQTARLRGADSHIAIVASVPKDRGHDSPQAITAYLNNLREDLMQLRLPSSALDRVEKLRENFRMDVKEAAQKKKKGGDNEMDRKLFRIINSNFKRLKNDVLEPSFVQDVDIHGPPLFRCFLSHSASPEYDERDHITRLKAILEAEVFEVVEGEFSLGQSTDALSRGRIRHCDLFVSFLWPRESFRRIDGTYAPPEWITHEESFAIGQDLRVYRIIEESVENPRYEHDRPPFKFKKNDLDSWSNLERAFRLEIRQLALRILLGAK